jgi:hypothetical protein
MQVTDEMVEAAWAAYENTPIDLLADSDDETKRCVVNALTAALAAMWHNMDTAPKDGERILLGFRGSMSAEGFWHDGSQNHWKQPGWYFADDDLLTGRPCDPDCWQNLPSPPNAEG